MMAFINLFVLVDGYFEKVYLLVELCDRPLFARSTKYDDLVVNNHLTVSQSNNIPRIHPLALISTVVDLFMNILLQLMTALMNRLLKGGRYFVAIRPHVFWAELGKRF